MGLVITKDQKYKPHYSENPDLSLLGTERTW